MENHYPAEECTCSVEQTGTLARIALSGRVHSANVNAVQQELNQVSPDTNRVIVSAQALEYISSAGLRLILQLKQKYKDVSVVDASPEVYEILSTTGFTEILDVTKALRRISLEHCEKISEGMMGEVYRLDNDTICKVYKGVTDKRYVEDECNRTRTAFVHGIPCVIPYDIVQTERGYGLVYETVGAKSFAKCLTQQPENFEELVDRFVALSKRLWQTELPPDALLPYKNRLRQVVAEHRGLVKDACLDAFLDFLPMIPDRNTFIHTDMLSKNVRVAEDEMLLIDLADAGVGHPIFDLVALADLYHYAPKHDPEMVRKATSLTPELAARLWQRYTELLFADLPEDVAAARRQTAEQMALLFHARNVEKGKVIALTDPEDAEQHHFKPARQFFEVDFMKNRDFWAETLQNWK